MEKILAIKETNFGNRNSMAGYEITTDQQIIQLGIDDYQSCCEHWGYYITTEDDIADFIGADLIDIKESSTHIGEHKEDWSEKYAASIFVDIITSHGVLQFVAYNEHNGYYAHGIKVVSKQLNIDISL